MLGASCDILSTTQGPCPCTYPSATSSQSQARYAMGCPISHSEHLLRGKTLRMGTEHNRNALARGGADTAAASRPNASMTAELTSYYPAPWHTLLHASLRAPLVTRLPQRPSQAPLPAGAHLCTLRCPRACHLHGKMLQTPYVLHPLRHPNSRMHALRPARHVCMADLPADCPGHQAPVHMR